MGSDVKNTDQTDPAELAAYFADRPLMWRNVFWILVGNFGGSTCLGVMGPLMTLRLSTLGMGERGISLINSINLWVVSFLVMYFSWKSDHRVSRWGRRIPYLFLALPFLILTVVMFPLFNQKWVLVGLMIVYLYFLDMKNSTYPLLAIDCVPRDVLARISGISSTVTVATGFVAIRYGMKLADIDERLPYLICGVILTVTTLLAAFKIKEPPIRNPTSERFNPLSALKVGCRDTRMIVLMLGVALIQSFFVMYGNWIWLYAKNAIGFTRTESGAAISWSSLVMAGLFFPIGWIIDRWGSYKVLVGYWIASAASLWAILHITNPAHLAGTAILISLLGSSYFAADMMVCKQAPPADVGSVTASNSFIRNFYTGSLVFVSGYLIESFGGDYPLAFKLGFVMTSVGLLLFFVYRRLMRGPRQTTIPVRPEIPLAIERDGQ